MIQQVIWFMVSVCHDVEEESVAFQFILKKKEKIYMSAPYSAKVNLNCSHHTEYLDVYESKSHSLIIVYVV